MLIRGIPNHEVNVLLARIRHTHTLGTADRGSPSWPTVETLDVSLIDEMPTGPYASAIPEST